MNTDTPPDAAVKAPAGRRARGGADARRATRSHPKLVQLPYITRRIPLVTVLDEEGLTLIEGNADIILEEIGIEFRDDEEALQMWREAGADVKGTRVHFPRGLPRALIQKTAPREYVQHARNPERNVSSAAITPSSRRSMAHPSFAPWTMEGAMPPSRISAIS
jgi:Trimethylamine:corrinoid methyltransferase